MRILKIDQCLSLSGGFKLTYHIGCNDQEDLYFRLFENSGGGMFSKQWIPWVAIEGFLDGDIASWTLKPFYEGKSINSPGFVLAVLLHEKLVQPGGKSCIKSDSRPFLQAIRQLIDSGINLAKEGTPEGSPGGSTEGPPESKPEDRPKPAPEDRPPPVAKGRKRK